VSPHGLRVTLALPVRRPARPDLASGRAGPVMAEPA